MCASNQRRLPPIFSLSTTRLPSTLASADAPPASIRLAPSAARGTPHVRGAFSRPTPAPRKPGTCGRYRTGRRLRRQSAPAFPRSHTPPRCTPGPKRRPCRTTSLHLVMALSPLDYRCHPAIPFPQRIHWSTWHDTIASIHHTCHFRSLSTPHLALQPTVVTS
jgi:hypothetical protein